MKTLSLWQPWASLVATGIKHYETRSWKPPDNILGQRIAIHAASKWNPELENYLNNFYIRFQYQIDSHKMDLLLDQLYPNPIRGAIVGTVMLSYYRSTESTISSLSNLEFFLGDYTPNRYVWVLEYPIIFKNPIITRGYQRLWEWDDEEFQQLKGS